MACGDVGCLCALCVRLACGGGVSLLPVEINGSLGVKLFLC